MKCGWRAPWKGFRVNISGHRGDALLEPLQAEFCVAQFMPCFVALLAAAGRRAGRQPSFELGNTRTYLPRLVLAQCLYPVSPTHMPSPPKACSVAAKTLNSRKYEHSKFNQR